MLKQRPSMLGTRIIQRIISIIISWIAVVLDALGVVLPLLPTTSLTLLVAWYFARSPSRFHDWLFYHLWFGRYSYHWQRRRVIPSGAEPRVILLILVTFDISLWLVNIIRVRGLLLIILACLLIFTWWIPVTDEEQQRQ